MKTAILIVLYASLAYGVLYLALFSIRMYGEQRFQTGWDRGADYQKQRCWSAHRDCVLESDWRKK